MLKKGDKVVMHSCGEAEHYDGKVWTCMSDEYTKGDGVFKHSLIDLESFGRGFLTEFLQKVNVEKIGEKSRADSIEVIEEMILSEKINGEEFLALKIALIALGK